MHYTYIIHYIFSLYISSRNACVKAAETYGIYYEIFHNITKKSNIVKYHKITVFYSKSILSIENR